MQEKGSNFICPNAVILSANTKVKNPVNPLHPCMELFIMPFLQYDIGFVLESSEFDFFVQLHTHGSKL